MALFLFFVICWAFFYTYGRLLGYYHLSQCGAGTTMFDVRRDYNWKPKVTFMIPSYNEGQVVEDCINSIMASNYPTDMLEIIAVDDGSSDDTWEHLQAMQQKYPDNVIVWKNTPNKGKPFTLIDIINNSTGEIIFTVDSDTIVQKDAIKEMVSCYADPEIGGVGGEVRVKNLNDSLWTQMQGMLYANLFYLVKTVENQFLTSRCLCGPLASFRHEIFVECIPLIREREFLGVKPIKCGEDAYLTTRISLGSGISKKWKIFNCNSALAWTDNPATTKAYLLQQLRWWRGSMLNGTYVLGNLYKNIMHAGVSSVMVTLITVMGVFTSFLLLAYFWISGWFVELFVITLIANAITGMLRCLAYNRLIGKNDPVIGKMKNPILTGCAYGVWTLIAWFVLSILSLFTMDDGGWVTRQDGASNVG